MATIDRAKCCSFKCCELNRDKAFRDWEETSSIDGKKFRKREQAVNYILEVHEECDFGSDGKVI